MDGLACKNHYSYEQVWIKSVSVILFLLGLMNILSAWLSFNSPRLQLLKKVMEYEIITGSRCLVILTGIASLIVAPALFRQKRIAWYIAVVTLGLSGLAHILKGADIEEASICLVFFGVLLPLYKYCNVKSDPLRVIYSGKIFLASIVFVALYTILGIMIFSDKLGVDTSVYSIWSIIADVMLLDTTKLAPQGLAAKFYMNSLYIINSFTLITGLILSLSPVIARSLPDHNLEKYQNLTRESASQAVQFFAVNGDYQHFYFNTTQQEGLISYKVSNRVALAIGNPCVAGNLDDITKEWLEMVCQYDWIPAIYQAQGDFVEVMKSFNFDIVPVGVEALIDLSKFTLEGKAMQDLRSGRNKGNREGWTVEEYRSELWKDVNNLNSKWVSIHGGKEIGFAMGKLTPEYLENTRTVLLYDRDNKLQAYLNNINLPLSKTRSVDLMRRNPDSPKGVMEFLFLNEILQAQKEGYEYYDLGFSPLAIPEDSFSSNKEVVKLFKLIYEKQKKYYDFQGLHQFKSKFKPDWQQSYLVYPNIFDLPKVLMALLVLNKGS